MCGIIFAESFTGQPVNNDIISQFMAQRHRGTEGFGAFDRTYGRLIRATKERKMLGWMKNHPRSSLMFHHRYPTSTMNRKNACHPFSTRRFFPDMNYVLIHNGHISNSYSLRTKHQQLGISYNSFDKREGKFNDSEALLWDVALYLEGQQDKLQAEGGIAFVCLAIPTDPKQATKLYFGRNSNPLHMQLDETGILLSSEGMGAEIQAQTLYSYDYQLKELTTTPLNIPTYSYEGGYSSTYSSGWSSSRWDDDEYDELKPTDYPRYLPAATNLIPTGNFGWDSLHDGKEVWVAVGSENVPIKTEVLNRIELYMDNADGIYIDATSMLSYDQLSLRRQRYQDTLYEYDPDRDLQLEIELLGLALDALYECPEWNTMNDKDTRYAAGFTSAV